MSLLVKIEEKFHKTDRRSIDSRQITDTYSEKWSATVDKRPATIDRLAIDGQPYDARQKSDWQRTDNRKTMDRRSTSH